MKLTPEWITGFADGDGCFSISKRKSNSQVAPLVYQFVVIQDQKSVDVLYALKKEFGCGRVYSAGGTMYNYVIARAEHVRDICIPFFIQHPLQTKKKHAFYSWALSFRDYMIAHQKDPGAPIPPVSGEYRLSAGWFRGFVDAEGCFYASIVGGYIKPRFILGANFEDKELIHECQRLIKCGTLHTCQKDNFETLQVSRVADLEEKLVPFFETRGSAVLLRTRKRLAFQKFRKILRIMMEKRHLSPTGADLVKKYVGDLSLENKFQKEKSNLIAQDIVQTDC